MFIKSQLRGCPKFILFFTIFFTIGLLLSCNNNKPEVNTAPTNKDIITGPRGIVAHKDAIAIGKKLLAEKGAKTIKVTDGVYVITGLGISNCFVIEGESSIIIGDTGDNIKESRAQIEEIRKITNKPVSAIIYSHWHYTGGAKAYLNEGNDIQIIGHKKLDFNRTNAIGLLGPTILRRVAFQMGMYLPKEGADAAPFGTIEISASESESGYVKPTHTVSNGETIEIDGVKMQFFTPHRSDTDCSLIVHFPDLNLAYNNHSFPMFPNIYSLRGGSFRHPKTWIEGIDLMLDLDPEHLVVTHGFPTSGKDAVRQRLTNYRDAMQFLYDQTIRGMNRGLSPDELIGFIKLPPHLAEAPNLQQFYITKEAVIRQIYNGLVGWFDEESVNIQRLDPVIKSNKIITGFGGREVVFEQAQNAFKNREYQWAANLATHLVRTGPEDREAKQLKADILRRLGQLSAASNLRNWYLTQARVLEGKIDLSKPPGVFLTKSNIMEAPEFFIKALRARLDPDKSKDTNRTIGYHFTDAGKKVSMHIRRGVAVYKDQYPENGVDIEVSMSSETWAKIILKEIGIFKAIISRDIKITKGSITDFKDFMGLFDKA